MTNYAFHRGDRVKLLVSFYARAVPPRRKLDGKPASRFLLSNEALRFVADRPELRGGAIIEDATGARWYCPRDYLTFPHLTDASAEAA